MAEKNIERPVIYKNTFTFDVSKKINNSRKINKPVIYGSRLAYDASKQARYVRNIKKLVSQMIKETNREINNIFDSQASNNFFSNQEKMVAMDESIASKARISMNALSKKFENLFSLMAKPTAQAMVKGQNIASKQSLNRSLKQISEDFTLQGSVIPVGLKEVGKSLISENISLIKSIPSEYMTSVTGSVMRAITLGGDIGIIKNNLITAIGKEDELTRRRAKNIALDQTRKAYNSINMQRMLAVGIKSFEWLHSGGGQKPRKDHIEMNGNIYDFDNLPVIDRNTGERGIPGQAYNCGCTMKPVVQFEND